MLDVLAGGNIQDDHYVQMQGVMWIAMREFCDYVLFTDVAGIPCIYLPVERDEKMCTAFAEHIPLFCLELAQIERGMREMGGGVADVSKLVDNSAWLMGKDGANET